MRAMALFLREIAAPTTRSDHPMRGWAADSDDLVPLQPGAFARWMARRDAGLPGRQMTSGDAGQRERRRPLIDPG